MSEQKVSPWRLCGAEAVCRESRNTMMAPQADTPYRDRVDMMAAALISGIHTIMAEKDIAAWAIKQVDAIDKALAEREARDV